MDYVVPGVLQRLREADIVGLAGLTGASQGQEYCRSGYISATRRQGARLSGMLAIPDTLSTAEKMYAIAEQGETGQRMPGIVPPAVKHFTVEVEILNSRGCEVVCSCKKRATLICIHAAA